MGCVMYIEMLDNDQLARLRIAFDKACDDLGLGTNADDNGRRDHLAMLMLSLSKGGERDPNVIRTQAVHQMQPQG
jgi:hypothetical protein